VIPVSGERWGPDGARFVWSPDAENSPAFADGEVDILSEQVLAFGPFQLLPIRRSLLEAGEPLRLGSRALEILIALVERPGELITKEELIARVWPDTFVEEASLRVHVAALRKALGDGQSGHRYVVNVAGRGYRFVASVRHHEALDADPPAVEHTHNLPAPVTRTIGRADIIGALTARLPERRFVTIVGPGGIGKTTVALDVAHNLVSAYSHGVHLVDLASLRDPGLLPGALASALGLAIRSDQPVRALMAFLRDKQTLIILDSCEHVVEAAAALAEEVFNGVPGAHILATSREPLRAEGEWVQRLPPLSCPPASTRVKAQEALVFPAVQLFVERVTASLDTFELKNTEAPIVADICRRLDGIPLAIELAAGQVEVVGVTGLAALLDDRFRLLTKGRRTSLPRHQTLSATLDWSHELLPEPERVILRRLAVFAGSFTLEAVRAVAARDQMAHNSIEDFANLVAKSLVMADASGPIVLYRLPETTRNYALAKLTASGELQQVARHHAEYSRDLVEHTSFESDKRSASEWLGICSRQIDDIRAALDWAFSPSGDAAIGVALMAASVPLWTYLSLMEECRRRVAQALASLGTGEHRDKRYEMQLNAALGAALMYTKGTAPETRLAFAQALEIADSLDDTDYRLRALWGLWVDRMNDGAVRDAMTLAERFSRLASSSSDPSALPIGDRTMGFSLHFLGDQTNAHRHIERMLSGFVPALDERPIIRFQFDPWLTAQMRFAVILWLQGFPDRAARTVEGCISDALSINHAVTLCNAFAQGACPIALLIGDLSAAERNVTILLENSQRFGLAFWQADARCFSGILCIRHGDIARGVAILREVLDELSTAPLHTRYDTFLGALAEALGSIGDTSGGLAVVDRALERTKVTGGRWLVADLLRIKGELILREGDDHAIPMAEQLFVQSLDVARQQGALSLELRTATALARLHQNQSRRETGRNVLAPIFTRFTEGFQTKDLLTAKTLLDELT
jgi:predicted ATPase/DNA-binding winged helix-turn-helix (wHTH) protein